MKKNVALIACALVALTLASCKVDDTPVATSQPETTEVPVVTTVPVTTEEPVTTTLPVETTEEIIVTTTAPIVTKEPDVTLPPPVTTEATTLPEETTLPVETTEFDIAKSPLDEYIILGKYSGIEVFVDAPARALPEEVDAKVYEAMLALPEEAMVKDRAVEEGDTANIDFVGKIDGVAFDGGSAKGYPLEVGSGMMIPGFEEGIVGIMAGETKTVSLTFPEDYYNAQFAGVPADFDITVNFIYPTLTDEIAQNHLSFDSADAYRKSIEDAINAEYDKEFAVAKEEAAWIKAMANSDFVGCPENLLNSIFESSVEAYETYALMYGMTYEEFFPAVYGLSVEEAEGILFENAKNIVNQKLLLYAIARDMGIDVSDERFEEDLAATAIILGYESVEKLLEELGGDRELLKEEKLLAQVLTEIVANANFVIN
nr:FKBP-type peptidyl-prolyl cis-trans isomerase [Clostridia bacterium]